MHLTSYTCTCYTELELFDTAIQLCSSSCLIDKSMLLTWYLYTIISFIRMSLLRSMSVSIFTYFFDSAKH